MLNRILRTVSRALLDRRALQNTLGARSPGTAFGWGGGDIRQDHFIVCFQWTKDFLSTSLVHNSGTICWVNTNDSLQPTAPRPQATQTLPSALGPSSKPPTTAATIRQEQTRQPPQSLGSMDPTPDRTRIVARRPSGWIECEECQRCLGSIGPRGRITVPPGPWSR